MDASFSPLPDARQRAPGRAHRALAAVAALALCVVLVGCQGAAAPASSPPATSPPATAQPTSTTGAAGDPSPTPAASVIPSASIVPVPTDGPEKLILDLEATGADARLGELFVGDPFRAQGTILCIGSEPVRLFVFPALRDRIDAVEKINPTDPSDMGTSMVTWNGRPRLWHRDRLLIVYLGEDPATETLLKNVLGEPFASGPGQMLLPDTSCD